MPNHPLYNQTLPDNQSKPPLAQLETIYPHPINLPLRKRDRHPSHCNHLSDSCTKPWNLPSAFYSPDQTASSAPQISYFLSKISFEILKGLSGKKKPASRHICLCYQWHEWFSLLTYHFFLLFSFYMSGVWGMLGATTKTKLACWSLYGCSFSSK